jgi:type IV secretion system protein TrbL
MLTTDILNRITTAFMVALDGAYATLSVYSIGLLSFLGLMHMLLALGRLQTAGATLAALGEFLWVVLRIGVFIFMATGLYSLMWSGAFMTFLQWGVEAGGGAFSLGDFLNPSRVVDAGFRAAVPLYDFLNNLTRPGKLWNWDVTATYLAAYWVIVVAYGLIGLAVMMTLIEIKLAIATAAVLLPWGVLTQTAALGELCLSWLVAGLVWVLMTAALMAIGVPLFELLAIPAGRDPKLAEGVVMAIGALVFAGLAWVLPSRAASIGGRGMALALGSEVVVGAGMAGASGVRYAYHSGQAWPGACRRCSRKGAPHERERRVADHRDGTAGDVVSDHQRARRHGGAPGVALAAGGRRPGGHRPRRRHLGPPGPQGRGESLRAGRAGQ